MLDDISRTLSRQCSAGATLTSCTALSFRDWHIWNIEEGIFAGLVNLVTLDLGLNQLRQIRLAEFADLQSLVVLRLDHNQLDSSLNTMVFKPLAGLQRLYLDNNFFRSFNPAILTPFTGLRTLHLHQNFLSEGETYASVRGILDTVPTITDFSLARNGFDCIDTSYPITTTDITQCPLLIQSCGLCRFYRVANTPSRTNPNQLIRIGNCSDTILKGCTELSFSNSGITSLQSGVLHGLRELVDLYLEDNSLTTFPANSFRDLGKLKGLYLSGNLLTSVNKAIFSPLFVLERLELQDNRINTLSNNNFDSSPELQRLLLSGNRLSRASLSANCFQGIVFLETLHLNKNLIESLPVGIFANLANLQDLHLEENRLTTNGLPAGLLTDTVDLEQILLNDNNLATLPDGIFSTLPILLVVGLSGNPLTSLRSNLLSSSRIVTTVYLANTNLNALPPGLLSGLSQVTRIELQGSNLGSLSNDTFAGNTRLRTLLLANNNIDTWVPGLFASLPLTLVTAAGNPVGCFPVISGYTGRQKDVAESCVSSVVDCNGCLFQFDFETKVLGRTGSCSTCGPTVSFSGRGIKRLQSGALDGMSALVNLDLQSNVIDQLDALVFKDLTALEILNLNGNQLTSIPAGLFASNVNLRELRLNNNLLASLNVNTFFYQTAVTKLWLNDNRLAANDLSVSLFRNISTTAEIRLAGQLPNAITCIPVTLEHTGTLNPPACVKVAAACGACRILLDFPTKRLYREKACSAADIATGDCSTIRIESQAVQTLESGLFDGFSPLTTLSLKSNQLSTIETALFINLTNLVSLDLSGNRLTDIPSGAIGSPHMNALTTLRLANNQLSSLLAETYDLPLLTTLTLSGNTIGCAETLDSWGGTVDLSRCRQTIVSCGACTFRRSRFEGVLSRTGSCTGAECSSRSLQLSSRFLKSLTPGVFAGMTELITINLRGNSITSLPDGIFADLTKVALAYFEQNKIADINRETFRGLSAVTALNLANNLISRIRSNTFQYTSSVLEMQLDYNNIASLEECAFCGLGSLRELTLQYNKIEEIGESLLSPLVEMRLLYLRNNGLKAIHPQAFAGLSKLADLELFFNSLPTVPGNVFNGLPLTKLWLNENPLTTLPATAFQGLPALVDLTVGSSNLVNVPPGLFSGLPLLESLAMDSSRLTGLPAGIFDALVALRRLDLHANKLASLPAGVFKNNVNLRRLQLQRNLLTQLPAEVFTYTAKLQDVRLEENRLTSLPAGVFDNTTALTGVDLDANALSTLPLNIFAHTPNLNVVKMQGNQIKCAPVPSEYGLSFNAACIAGCSNVQICPAIFLPCGTCRFYVSFFTGALFFQTGSCVATTCTNMNLRNREITGFDPNVLDAFTNVVTIDLGKNQLDHNDLPELRLNLKPNLKHLLLDDNQIGAIPETTFSDSWNLETLNLTLNRVPTIAIEHLFCTKSLKTLLLSHNQISVLPHGVFNRSFLLETLRVDHNRLTTVTPQIAFDYIHWHLKLYDFAFNLITLAPEPTWSGLRALEELKINDNRIEDLEPVSMTQPLHDLLLFDVRNNRLAWFLDGHYVNMARATILTEGNPFGPRPPSITVAGYDVSNNTLTPPIYSGLARVTLQQTGSNAYAYTSNLGTVSNAPNCASSRTGSNSFIVIYTTAVSVISCDSSQLSGRRDTEVVVIDESYHITRTTNQIAAVITVPEENTVVVGLAQYFSIENYQVLVSSTTVRRFGTRGIADDSYIVADDDDAAPTSVVVHENTGRRLLDETVTVKFIASTPTEYERILAMLRALDVGGIGEQQGFTILVKEILGIVDTTPPPPPPPPPAGGGGGGGGGIFIPPPSTTSPPIILIPSTTPEPDLLQYEVTEGGGWSTRAVIAISVGLGALVVMIAGCLAWQNSGKNSAGPRSYGMTRDQGKYNQQYYAPPYPNNGYGYAGNPYAHLASPMSAGQYSLPAHPYDQSGLYASTAPGSVQVPGSAYLEGGSMDRSLYQTQQSIPPGEYNAFSPFQSPQKSIMSNPASPAMPNPYQSPFQSPSRADLSYVR